MGWAWARTELNPWQSRLSIDQSWKLEDTDQFFSSATTQVLSSVRGRTASLLISWLGRTCRCLRHFLSLPSAAGSGPPLSVVLLKHDCTLLEKKRLLIRWLFVLQFLRLCQTKQVFRFADFGIVHVYGTIIWLRVFSDLWLTVFSFS